MIRLFPVLALGLSLAALPVLGASAASAALPQAAADAKPLPSPPADASVTLDGKHVMIHYNTPSARGRKIFGGKVPYGEVWRTGANPATVFKTDTKLKIGNATVPPGNYTLYSLPSESTWMLIINKQTGQWGTEYHQDQDLVRIPMHKATLSSPQEKMSISFEDTHGKSTQLHIKWVDTDVSVQIEAE